jgi:hypothetical protein
MSGSKRCITKVTWLQRTLAARLWPRPRRPHAQAAPHLSSDTPPGHARPCPASDHWFRVASHKPFLSARRCCLQHEGGREQEERVTQRRTRPGQDKENCSGQPPHAPLPHAQTKAKRLVLSKFNHVSREKVLTENFRLTYPWNIFLNFALPELPHGWRVVVIASSAHPSPHSSILACTIHPTPAQRSLVPLPVPASPLLFSDAPTPPP